MDLPSLLGEIAMVEAALTRMRAAPRGSVSARMWQDALRVLEDCHEELAVAEAQIRFHRLEAAGWRAGEYRTSPWTSRVLDRLPVPVMSASDTGSVMYANRAAGRMLGVGPERLLRKPLAVHVHLDHRLVFRRAWQLALHGPTSSADPAGRPGVTAQVVLRTRHGGSSWRRLVMIPEEDGGRIRVMALPVGQTPDSGIDGAEVGVSRGIAAIAALPMTATDDATLLARALGHAVAMPGVVAASFVEVDRTGPVQLASSSSAGYAVEALQHELGEGPGLDARRLHRTVASDDLSADVRWPAFGSRAAALGYHAVVAVPVDVGGDPADPPSTGVVTLWGPVARSIPAGLVSLAGAVADSVAAAVGVHRRLDAVARSVAPVTHRAAPITDRAGDRAADGAADGGSELGVDQAAHLAVPRATQPTPRRGVDLVVGR